MKKLTKITQLTVGEQYRFIITYKGNNPNEDNWLSCDIVTEIIGISSVGMVYINNMLTNNPYYWPIGKDEFMLEGMILDHDIEFQKL